MHGGRPIGYPDAPDQAPPKSPAAGDLAAKGGAQARDAPRGLDRHRGDATDLFTLSHRRFFGYRALRVASST